MKRIVVVPTLAVVLTLAAGALAHAQNDQPAVQLVVRAGTPLRVALDKKVRVARVGQELTGTLVEPIYAYDRVVIPAGTKAIGHIERFAPVRRMARVAAVAGGDFTPPRKALVQFDRLLPSGAAEMAMQTALSVGVAGVVLKVAEPTEEQGVTARAREEVARQAKQAIEAIRAPGKLERLKDKAIDSLPYHPTYLRKGTVYTARLVSPLEFGSAAPIARAPAGTSPAPESILTARLTTGIDSSTSTRGNRIEAVLTQPVFSADRRLILPEGTTLRGEVTMARPARRFHRGGRLRFLFDSVQIADDVPATLLGSLYSVESRSGDRVAIDDEGGAKSSSSATRFVAPALSVAVLSASLEGRLDFDTDGAGPETKYGGFGSGSVGGFLGLASLGVALAQVSHPVTVGLAALGLARTTYSAVFGMGHNVAFPIDTSVQIRLAPGPAVNKK